MSCRLRFLDIARGCTVALMLFVNHAGHGTTWIAHATWDGVHLADLVMPCFLLLVGVSVALSLGPRASVARGPLLHKVLARTGAPYIFVVMTCRSCQKRQGASADKLQVEAAKISPP